MMSSKAKYALRALILLAERDGWTLTSDVAEHESIPRKFLEAILVELRDANTVESRRGRHGGHRLARPAEEISVGDVLRLIDGPLALTPCSSRTQFRACADCTDIRSCTLRHILQQARDAIAGVLDGCSLADLVRQRKKGTVTPELRALQRAGISVSSPG
jgi:Rrf2 family protein